jgi:threonine/homoserine/homoserine lactone efflux protein
MMLGIADDWAFVAAAVVILMLPGRGSFALLAAFARTVGAPTHRKAARWLERSAGVFPIGFGIKLAQ